MLAHFSTLILQYIQSGGYFAIFWLMTLESALLPVPSEVVMPFAGFLISKGTFVFWLVVLAGALGNLAGSLVGYYLGYALGESVVLRFIRRYGTYVLVSPEDYELASAWFKKYGNGVVFFSRLLPAVRTYISLPAGVFRSNIWKFILYTFVGSLLWSAFLTYIGMYLGERWDTLGPLFAKFQYAIIALFVLALGYFVYRKLSKARSRR